MTKRLAGPLLFSVLLLSARLLAGTALAQSPLHPGVTVDNRSNAPIKEIQMKPAGSSKWEPNVLQGDIAPRSKQPVHIAVESNCRYDLRLVYGDGKSEEKQKVDLCKNEDLVVGGR